MSRSTEIGRPGEPEVRSSTSPTRPTAELCQRLLRDALVTGNRALLLGWARLELDRQLADLEPTGDEDEIPF